MEIKSCSMRDVSDILRLYEAARQRQIQRQMVVWPPFEASLIESEIQQNRQWKIDIGGEMACNWVITFADKEIWQERDMNDAIYIHRICTHPTRYGNRYIDGIVDWAKKYARQTGRRFVRLDTLGNNTKLIEHYTSAGFTFLGIFRLADTTNLPAHYQSEPDCCLFEIDMEAA